MDSVHSLSDPKLQVPLLEHQPQPDDDNDESLDLVTRVRVEYKKLWHIVGPSIFSRVASYSMLVITQAFAGHLGDLELAAISIANNVVVGFDFGLLRLLPNQLRNRHLLRNRHELLPQISVYVLLQCSLVHVPLLCSENQEPAHSTEDIRLMFVIINLSELGMASALETLCGQAYGAKKYYMLGVYMQRSWIVMFICCILLLPMYIFATPALKLLGQTEDVAELSGDVVMWMIPLHFSFAFQFPLQRFLQSQMKTAVIAWVSALALLVHILISWAMVCGLKLGVVGIASTINFSWWVLVFGLFAYTVCGGCPLTWTGFSIEAFSGLWEFTKLSAASGVMLCLENWYYKILILMTGNLKNAEIAIDALSICMTINGWELMIPLAFFAGAGVRVANELGAGNGKGAKFATIVAVTTSSVIGFFFWLLIIILRKEFGLLFSNSEAVLDVVSNLSILLAFTVLLNSVQPVLSGVAVGSGWQSYVAYINLGCYYLIGVPLGFIMGWVFNQGVMGIWAGMIFGGTAVQTLVLCIITIRCDWNKEAEKATLRVRKWEASS